MLRAPISVPPPAEKGQTRVMVSVGNSPLLFLAGAWVAVCPPSAAVSPPDAPQAVMESASAHAVRSVNVFFIGCPPYFSSIMKLTLLYSCFPLKTNSFFVLWHNKKTVIRMQIGKMTRKSAALQLFCCDNKRKCCWTVVTASPYTGLA